MKYYISLSLILVLLLSGCARTVSSSDETLHLEFNVSTNGPINTQDSIYVVIFSSSQTILPINPNIDDYFIFPGKNLDDAELATYPDRSITYYYNTYFKHWQQFLYIHNGTIELFQSSSDGFSQSTATIQSHLSYAKTQGFEYQYNNSPSNMISITLDIQQLGYEHDDSIYFSILTLRNDSTESGFIQDFLIDDTSHQINLIKHQENMGDHPENTILDNHRDITQWQYSIY